MSADSIIHWGLTKSDEGIFIYHNIVTFYLNYVVFDTSPGRRLLTARVTPE